MLDDPSWHLDLPDSIIQDIRQSIARPGELPYYQLTPVRIPTLERKVNQLLDVWVNAFGFDPLYAVKAASYWPSVLMGVDKEVGTVSPGKYADIIAVKGDVLRHIALLQDVDMVFKHGKRYK